MNEVIETPGVTPSAVQPSDKAQAPSEVIQGQDKIEPKIDQEAIDREVNSRISKAFEAETSDYAERVKEDPTFFSKLTEKRQRAVARKLDQTIEDLLLQSKGDEEPDEIDAKIEQALAKVKMKSEQSKVDDFVQKITNDSTIAQVDRDAIREEFESIFYDLATSKQTLNGAEKIMQLAKIKVLGESAIKKEDREASDAHGKKMAANIGININRSAVKKEIGEDFIADMLRKFPSVTREDILKYSKK